MPNNHHYKLRDLSFSCSCVLCCVSYAVADIWMMIYVLSLPVCSCSVPGSVLVVCCRVEVWHILFVLISLYSVL